MKTWRLATKHKKSFHEAEAWSKGKLELIHDVIWQSGSFTIESDTKPEIDLVNKEGLDPDNNSYSYEFDFEESRRLSENTNENLAARITPPPIFMAQP